MKWLNKRNSCFYMNFCVYTFHFPCVKPQYKQYVLYTVVKLYHTFSYLMFVSVDYYKYCSKQCIKLSSTKTINMVVNKPDDENIVIQFSSVRCSGTFCFVIRRFKFLLKIIQKLKSQKCVFCSFYHFVY